MTVGRSEYFRREAGDYLRELEPLLGSGTPSVEALVRLARGLRGAAMLAGHATLSLAAGELEHVVKLLAEGAITWAEVAPAIRHTVGRFRQLVGSPQRWDRSNDDEAKLVARDLQSASGRLTRGITSSPPLFKDHETAAYVARLARTAANEIDRAARGVATKSPSAVELHANAQRSLQTLRGLAGLDEYSPLAELIEATDTLLRELRRSPGTDQHDGEVLSLGAAAIDRISRSVADGTPPVADDPQITSFTQAMFTRLSRNVTSIDELLDHQDDGAITPYGGRSGPIPASPHEMVAIGESLQRAGQEIRLAPTRTSRQLVALTHALWLQALPGGLGRRPAGRFLTQAVACLEGRAGMPLELAGAVLEEAGSVLTPSHQGLPGTGPNPLTLESALDELATRLAGSVPTALGPHHDRQPIVPIESLQVTDPVPIESLLLSQPIPIEELHTTEPVSIETLLASEPIPIALLAPDTPPDRTQFERSLSTYSRLLRTEARIPTFVEREDLPSSAEQRMSVVPIERLLFRGRRALERADQLRVQLEGALPSARQDLERLEPLFQELLDLVPLALVADD
jgi:hypothetical protein